MGVGSRLGVFKMHFLPRVGGIGLSRLLFFVQFLWSEFSWRRSLQFEAISAAPVGCR
jgi:hypothetical protein